MIELLNIKSNLEAQQKANGSKIKALETTLKQKEEHIIALLQDKVILENGLKIEQKTVSLLKSAAEIQEKKYSRILIAFNELLEDYAALYELKKKLQITCNKAISACKKYGIDYRDDKV